MRIILLAALAAITLAGAGCTTVTVDQHVVTGTYSYSDMLGVACFDIVEAKTLDADVTNVCFANSDTAKAALESTTGEVTILIEDVVEAPADYVDPGHFTATFVGVLE